MSMPSSRLEVATTAGSRPALRASSIRPRCSFDTDPWWARASSGTAPREAPDCAMIWAGCTSPPSRSRSPVTRSSWISFIRAQSRSASRRELANTIVDRCASTRSTMRSSTCGQIDVRRSSPAAEPLTSPVVCPSSARSSTGTTTSSSMVLADGGCTTSTSWAPPRNRATSSTGRTVALRPTRWAGCSSRWSSRSSDSARWAPRLVPATAWTSSTITVSTPRSDSRAWLVRIRNSDSGVVMRMSGGVRPNRRRSSAGVSPDRTPTVRSGSGRPSRVAACRMPASGARRLRSTSTASAFIGLT